MHIPVSCFLFPIFSFSEKLRRRILFLKNALQVLYTWSTYRNNAHPAFGDGFLIPAHHAIFAFQYAIIATESQPIHTIIFTAQEGPPCYRNSSYKRFTIVSP